MMETRHFVLIGIMVAVVIGVVAVFLASSNPDGLESTALIVQGEKTLTGDTPPDAEVVEDVHGVFAYESPMPDYSVGGLGISGQVIAILVGIGISFIIVLGVARVASRQKDCAGK
jgi:cobalt/nickel transport protein